MDLVVKGGTVVTATDTYRADVGVSNGKIAEISHEVRPDGARVLDASGKLVIPGGIDPHTHLDTPSFNTTTADDYRTGTVAAACGGTTTVINFLFQQKDTSLLDTVNYYRPHAEGQAVIDYGFHTMVMDVSGSTLDDLGPLAAAGITSIKIFMAYRGMLMLDDHAILKVFDRAAQEHMLVMVHAENGDAADVMQQKLLAQGKTEPKWHAASRPPRVEAEATNRAAALAELIGNALYFVHVSCAEAVEEIDRARARGVPAMGETCTHYLYFTEEDLDRPDFEGAKWVYTPPARTQTQPQAMWRALASNDLQLVGSDHAAFNFKDAKTLGRDNFAEIPNGAPGIEERLMGVYQGVSEGKLSLNRWVEVTSTQAAKIFGLYPEKGTIAVGTDADLVLWDPNAELKVTQSALHHAVDYTLYEGRTFRGVPHTVTLRGQVIVENRQPVGPPGTGRFLARKRFGQA
jgi:dihydropyrimidinase